MLDRSWLSPNGRRSSSGGTSHPSSSFVPFAGTFATPFRIVMSRSCWSSVAWRSTIRRFWRWVQDYAPELEEKTRPHLKATNKSWRVDETYVRIKGRWFYLYRAIDSAGATIDFFLSAFRSAEAAKALLAKALADLLTLSPG
jgi:hypothetical protein